MSILQIHERSQLRALARRLRVRPDWHEPDEQGVTAEVLGTSFDNAGFWGAEAPAEVSPAREMWVRLSQDGQPVADINLATLLAWAAAP